jgi:hypothetical protein
MAARALWLVLATGSLVLYDGVAWHVARPPGAAVPAMATIGLCRRPVKRTGEVEGGAALLCAMDSWHSPVQRGSCARLEPLGRVAGPSHCASPLRLVLLPDDVGSLPGSSKRLSQLGALALTSSGGLEGGSDGRELEEAMRTESPGEAGEEPLPHAKTSSSSLGSVVNQPEAAWPQMRDMGKVRDECKALLAESRELVLKDFELAKKKWEIALDTVETTGEPERIVLTYNLVLNLCALAATRGRAGAFETALDAMSRMVERGATPTLISFNTLMNVCAKSAAAELGEQAVLNAHTVLSMMEDAHIKPDVITFTSMLDACARAAAVRGGRGGWTRGWQNGVEVLEIMREKGVKRTAMVYNVLISICVTGASTRLEGQWVQEAVERGVSVLETMRKDGVKPDSDTYNHLFTVCAKAAGAGYKDAAEVVRRIFNDLREEGLAPEMGVETWNALVNTYAKCANLSLAQELVSVEMPAAGVTPDRITWNTVMHAVANEASFGRLSGMQHGLQV